MYTANIHYMTLTATHHKASHVIPCAADTLRGLRDAIETALNANDDACACMDKTLVGMTGAEIEVFADGVKLAVWHVCRFNHYLLKGLEAVREASKRFYVYTRNVWERLCEIRRSLLACACADGAAIDTEQTNQGTNADNHTDDHADANADDHTDDHADGAAIDTKAPSQMGVKPHGNTNGLYLCGLRRAETTHRTAPAYHALRRTPSKDRRDTMGNLFERRRRNGL